MSSEVLTSLTVTVDDDGKVTIPETYPGETITLLVPRPMPAPKAQTPEERQAALAQILERARRLRAEASPEWLALDHGEWLYGEHGLSR